MRKQRISFEKELRDLIQKDDITATLVTIERSEIKVWVCRTYYFINNLHFVRVF